MIESYSYRRPDDYYRDVARGGVEGVHPFSAYGRRTTGGAESNILWPNGAFTVPSVAGVTVSFKSDDIADTAAGTGIRTVGVVCVCVDTSYTEHFAVITMNGTSDSADTLSGVIFIQCMFMVTWGSNKAAVGNISAYDGSGTYSYIEAGAQRCSSSLRMVPAGKRLLVVAAVAGSVSGTAAAGTSIGIVSSAFRVPVGDAVQEYDYSADSIFMPQADLVFQDGSFGLSFPIPMPFQTGDIVGMEFSTDKVATIVGTWFGLLEERP